MASELTGLDLWWNGPKWMIEPIENWPKSKIVLSRAEIDQAEKEEKNVQSTMVTTEPQQSIANHHGEIIERWNNIYKITRTIAIVQRYANNFIHKMRPMIRPNRIIGPITLQERNNALEWLIKIDQATKFSTEIAACKTNATLKKSKLIGLRPFLDDNGVLRVNGRIENSDLSYDTKYPIVLPNSGTLVQRIIGDCHTQTGHGGCKLMLQYLRQKFWIVNMRKLTKAYIRTCVVCKKANAQTAQQQMGVLPAARVTVGRCFQDTGLDYFGPFTMKARPGRCKIYFKGYGIIYKCMRTFATAIELVEDMTKDSFLHAIARVMSIRGRIERIWCDNATTLVGASNDMQNLKDISISIPNSREWKERGIEWIFIPPAPSGSSSRRTLGIGSKINQIAFQSYSRRQNPHSRRNENGVC